MSVYQEFFHFLDPSRPDVIRWLLLAGETADEDLGGRTNPYIKINLMNPLTKCLIVGKIYI